MYSANKPGIADISQNATTKYPAHSIIVDYFAVCILSLKPTTD